jgi:uncharacterized protein YdeI (YjbR/CyaY-like superfamily)
MPVTDYPILAFSSAEEWEQWLTKNYESVPGVRLQLFKKASGQASVNYDEALDAALCYGWIDGVKHAHDAQSWLQLFTPRRKRSMWSKRNIGHVERLIAAGRMRTPGLQQIEAAKQDGRWEKAYDAQSLSQVPADFLQALAKYKKAEAFYNTLNKANLYAIAYRLQTAKKPETRAKRMQAILEMMKKGEKFH